MAALPPEDSPVWDRMEDDIAAERWPVPSAFGWLRFWFRGPSNELHRRATFHRQLARSTGDRPQAWAFLEWAGPCSYVVAGAWLWLILYRHSESRQLYRVVTFVVWSLYATYWALFVPPASHSRFVRSYRRYVSRPDAASAAT
jgi:hypothetical protein